MSGLRDEENIELVSDQYGRAYEWRCRGCGRKMSFFGKGCERCGGRPSRGTWCPDTCMVVVGDEDDV